MQVRIEKQYWDGIEPNEAVRREYVTNGQEHEHFRDEETPVAVNREPLEAERRYIQEQENS